jgi:Asp-tRNA(Asn)/Glu-tRNA(Gln) amidotransferase C subunit
MDNYNNEIQTLQNPTFQQIRKIAENSLSHLSRNERDELQTQLNRGVNLLTSHELLCQYTFAYGNMHEAKINKALSSIQNPKEVFNNNLAIIDWGCGQGLATVCFFDFFKKLNIPNNIQKVILIEPSEQALGRAILHTNIYLKDESKIKTICKYIDDVQKSDIETNDPITLHFFSNILDIQQIDLMKLAQLFENKSNGEHYFFCVGPLNNNNNRIDEFYNYFNSVNTPNVLSNLQESDNKLDLLVEDAHKKDIENNYTLKLKVFKFERNTIYFIPMPKIDDLKPREDLLVLNTRLSDTDLPFDLSKETPFIKYLYVSIIECLNDENATISKIRHDNFKEHYTFSQGQNQANFIIHYKLNNKISTIQKPTNLTEFAEGIFSKLIKLQNKTIIIS